MLRLVIAFLVLTISVQAQKDVWTFGVGFKPIIPSNLFQAGEESTERNEITYTLNQRLGYSFGGVIRAGFTDWLSLETGINYVRRNFSASVENPSVFSDTNTFRLIGYELPVLGMVYVKLADQMFMDVAFGLSLDMYPTNISSSDSPQFAQVATRRRWIQPGLLANVGWEFRTKSSGYFYVGASYHRPFQSIYLSEQHYVDDPDYTISNPALIGITGNYLTIDLRYFFHEEPKEKKVKEKRDPDTMPQWMKRGQEN